MADETTQLFRRINDSMKSTGTSAMKLFRQLDRDRDGFIGKSDLSGLLLAFDKKCRAAVLAEAFRRFRLDQKPCISEEIFISRWEVAEEAFEDPGLPMQFCWMPGPPGRRLHRDESAQLLELVQSNVKNVPMDTNDLEFLIPGHPEAVWAREMYLSYYEKHTERLEGLMHRAQAAHSHARSKEAFYFSLLDDQCAMISSEFYVWRIRSPGLLNSYLYRREGEGPRAEQLAWHGASGDLHQQALQGGELRPSGQMLNGLQPWMLASQPMQTFGKGPEWTVFYLCLVRVKESEMTRSSMVFEDGRVLPLYCLVHPSIWHTWPSGEWP